MSLPRRWGFGRSLLVLSPILFSIPLLVLRVHYALPDPLVDLIDGVTGLPQISEARILSYAKHLSEQVGYRIVGTSEHALGDAWMMKEAEKLVSECNTIAAESGRRLQCEAWRQQGSGSHRFDMMGKRLYKSYKNLSNIIVHISDGTKAGKAHAILANAHLDSTLPSPGAADDALSVGVLLESARVLINTPNWSPAHAIILLFNNAEESLQDGSHLYSTQHPTASTVRAVINLEAAGTTGAELLFQATSNEMIDAYSRIPRPMGTVVAADVFKTGIMLSDTDFRQFVDYLNITGLDLAIVGNSYLYHMRKDLVENIQPGVAQHMAENTLALLKFLSSDESPLPSLVHGATPPSTVYFSYLGLFIKYSARVAIWIYSSVALGALLLTRLMFTNLKPALRKDDNLILTQLRGLGASFAALLGSLVGVNIVAAVMRGVGHGMSWFSNEFSCLALYAPPALAGALLSQCLIKPVPEQAILSSTMLMTSTIALILQLVGISSGAMFALVAAPLLVALGLNAASASSGDVKLWAYAIGQVVPLATGAQLMATVLDVFVPLTGRIGADAPADHVIGSIVAFLGAYNLPLAIPFVTRFGPRTLRRAIFVCLATTVAGMAFFLTRSPFDTMHQKRLFVVHMENTTTSEQHLHISTADGAPGFEDLVFAIAGEFGTKGAPLPTPIVMNEYNPDWDILYPFSQFLTPYKIPLNIDTTGTLGSSDLITISAEANVINLESGTRSLTLIVNHRGVIWPTIAFDARVISWTLDGTPPAEHARHFVKGAAFYGEETLEIGLVVEYDGQPLRISHVGARERSMWPHKLATKEQGGYVMKFFEELDEWVDKRTTGTTDLLLLGCVGGVTEI